jgi:N-methylhydantoinase A
MRAIRAVSSERGRDPREYALFAFGGNGPLFAAGMAEQLEMRRIVVPPAPGLFSSFGLLYADVEHHYVRTWRKLVREADPAPLGDLMRRMETAARTQLASEGFPEDRVGLRRSADCRYQGQSFELTVPLADGPIDAGTLAVLAESFGQEHERTYGHRAGVDEPVEIVNLRVVAQGVSDRPRVSERISTDRPGGGDQPTRRVYFGQALGWRETPVLDRPALATPREGPCIIEEYDATCVVPPGARGMLDAYGNIAIELGREI